MTLFHLAESRSWAQAQSSGAYTQSTLGRSLEEEGFIHASSAQQWPVVRRAFYAGVDEPLVLLEIDEAVLTAPVVREVGNLETGEVFPHVYGPINVDAVVATTVLDPPHG